jgi:hypothetical protein
MGDASVPWRHGGDDHRPNDDSRHLSSPRAFTPPRYVLGYGVTGGDDPDGNLSQSHPDAGMPRPGDGDPGYGETGHQVNRYDGGGYGANGHKTGAYEANGYDAGGYYSDEDDYGHSYDAEAYDEGSYDGDHEGGGVAASLRAAGTAAAWRYRSAPLWARVAADVVAASLVLVLIVGVSLALRQDDGDAQPSAATRSTTTELATTTTSTAPTTTTTAPTTTAPTTTTTVPPTTTTAPPVVPPPTEPLPPPTTVAPTTTTQGVRYRDCTEAWFAGALPLFEGEPGYSPRLDRDGDGEACEWDERGRD